MPSEPVRLRIVLDVLPRLNAASNVHWQVKLQEKRRLGKMISDQLWSLIPVTPLQQARICLTRRSSQEPDYDNLVSSGKLVIDHLVRLGVLADDSPAHMSAEYRWEKAPRGKGSVVIEVEEIAQEAANTGRVSQDTGPG